MWSKCVIVLRLVNLNGKVLNKYGHELVNGGKSVIKWWINCCEL